MTQEPEVPTDRSQLPDHHEVLRRGEIEVLGRLVNSSNETFLVDITYDDEQCGAVYKPQMGERPLRDFAPGLHRREHAAYVLSEALGWHLVPPTVIRDDGPFGIGSFQLFIDHDPAEHYFTLYSQKTEVHDQLRRMALFDLVANNADRKSGHVLIDEQQKLWGIDHGLCFAVPLKLRTVIWDFAGEQIAAQLLDDIAPLAKKVPEELANQLDWRETEALQERVAELLASRCYPHDLTGRRFPWPLI